MGNHTLDAVGVDIRHIGLTSHTTTGQCRMTRHLPAPIVR